MDVLAASQSNIAPMMLDETRAWSLWSRYRDNTMLIYPVFRDTLNLAAEVAAPGCIVECGVWRGGCLAAFSEVMPERKIYGFDSFQGLPPAQDIDGLKARVWQADIAAPGYYDNCTSPASYVRDLLAGLGGRDYEIIEGWFADTLPTFSPSQPIAILHLDGDWHASTLICLQRLYPFVPTGGRIILDDYLVWEGSAIAVHEFIASLGGNVHVHRRGDVCYIDKKDS